MSISLPALEPLLPGLLLVGVAILLLLYEVFAGQADRTYAAHLAVVGLGLSMFLSLKAVGTPRALLFGTDLANAPLIVDDFARVASALVAAAGLVAALLSPSYAKNAGHDHGEYYGLILFAVVGMMIMSMAGDLMTFFLGLETMSIAVYALTGLRAHDPRSTEAALKYFLMGAFATGFLLFGIALVYGATASVSLATLATFKAGSPLLTLGIALILIGFAFKVAAVPFHMWAPDVYEGAPTPVTGFMAVGVKAAAFIALLRLVHSGLGVSAQTDATWIPILSALAVLTILVGNVLALVQQNVKRMLAYSSVSHAGYLLIGVVAAARGEDSAGSAIIFYLTSYTFMTLGAFGVLTFLERKEGGPESERYGAFAGIGFRHPALGMAMSLFMVALAGMPPTGGFFGKLYLFTAAIRAEETWLAVVGIAGSLISVYYYLRVIVAFYMREVPEPGPTPTATRSAQLTLGVALAAFFVLQLGLFPAPLLALTKSAMLSLGL